MFDSINLNVLLFFSLFSGHFHSVTDDKKQYESIISGKQDQPTAKLILTKSYNYMIKEDREYLIIPLLELTLMLELKDKTTQKTKTKS